MSNDPSVLPASITMYSRLGYFWSITDCIALSRIRPPWYDGVTILNLRRILFYMILTVFNSGTNQFAGVKS